MFDHHVACITYQLRYPSCKQDMVALFDERDLSEKEALRIIRADAYDKRLITMSQTQYETVFRSLKGEETGHEDIHSS